MIKKTTGPKPVVFFMHDSKDFPLSDMAAIALTYNINFRKV